MKINFTICILLFATWGYGQFGQNIVQYDDFDWEYIQSKHFDIYYNGDGRPHAKFVAVEAERAYNNLSDRIGWRLKNRSTIIVYNSHNDFQQTNVIDSYLYEGIGGVTELYKNRVVIPYDGSHKEFKHVIHHELVHVFVNDYMYGGNLQSLISNKIKFVIPSWMNEGLAEYLSDGWSTNSDMWIRDIAINGGELPQIEWLNGYLSYRGGQSVWRFICQKWGEEAISEIFYQIKKNNNVERGLEEALGLDLEKLSEQWHQYLKKQYWPDVASRDNLKDIARALTDHVELENSYNIAPALSPDGSKIAIISNKSGTFALYLISAIDGIFLRKIIQGEYTAEFEELHILKPGITWSPDGEKIAFAAKSGKSDVLYIVDVKTKDQQKYRFKMEGIFKPSWSPTRNEIAFIGNNGQTSDIYLFNCETETIDNLTADWYTDDQVNWLPDGNELVFISDRGNQLSDTPPADQFIHNIDQMDIYKISRDSRKIVRLSDSPFNESYPVYSSDGKNLAFISDASGINNVYLLNDTLTTPQPITNVLTGISQISLSHDNAYLLFSGFEKSGYDIYMLSNPLDLLKDSIKVEPAQWTLQKDQSLFRRPDHKSERQSAVSYDNYVFSSYSNPAKIDTEKVVVELSEETTQDSTGEYLSYPYKTKFTLDLVQGYYSFSTTYSPEAMAYFLWSDMLGDHRIYLGTEMQISLKNSDYFLMYRYLPNKTDYNLILFHNAELYGGYYYDDSNNMLQIYQRLRQLGCGFYASSPFSRFRRLEYGLEYSYVEFSEIPEVVVDPYTTEMDETVIDSLSFQTFVPSMGYVWDNTRWSQTYPISGSRYYLRYEFSRKLKDNGLDFQTFSLDYRKYFTLFNGISFAGRIYAGTSVGENAEVFRVGGVPWIISSESAYYKNDLNYDDDLDALQGMFFTKYVMPVRGVQINELFGTNAVAMNFELRLPFLIYYFPTIKYIGQINGVIFTDFGMAWSGDEPDLWEGKSWDSLPNEFVWTYGFGPRFIFLGMPWQLDYAWQVIPNEKDVRMWYLSIGLDF